MGPAFAADISAGASLYAEEERSCPAQISGPGAGTPQGQSVPPPRCSPLVTWRAADSVTVDFDPLRLVITQKQKLGGEVVAAQKHIGAPGLGADNAWRSEIDAAFSAVEGDNLYSEFRIGLFDTRRPVILTRGGFGTEDFNRWRSNAVVDAAISLRGFDGRIEYAAGAAASETGMDRRTGGEPWLWLYEPASGRDGNVRANAMFQKLEAKVLDSDDAKATVRVLYANTGENFRSFQTNSLADILYSGESLNAFGSLQLGNTHFSVEKDAHSEPDYAFDENIIRLARGPIGFKTSFAREELREDSLVLQSDEILRARLYFDFTGIFEKLPAWAPNDITFGVSQRESAKPSLFSSEDAVRRSFGFGVSKSGRHFSTDIYAYWNERNDLTEAGGYLAASEFGADIVQSFFFDDWDFSLYAIMSDMRRERLFRRDGDETLVSGGASFSRKFERLPDIQVNIDAFSFDAGYIRDDYAFESHDISVRAQADISEQLLTGLGYVVDKDRPFSIFVGAYNGWSLFDDSGAPASRERETRLMLLLRRSR